MVTCSMGRGCFRLHSQWLLLCAFAPFACVCTNVGSSNVMYQAFDSTSVAYVGYYRPGARCELDSRCQVIVFSELPAHQLSPSRRGCGRTFQTENIDRRQSRASVQLMHLRGGSARTGHGRGSFADSFETDSTSTAGDYASVERGNVGGEIRDPNSRRPNQQRNQEWQAKMDKKIRQFNQKHGVKPPPEARIFLPANRQKGKDTKFNLRQAEDQASEITTELRTLKQQLKKEANKRPTRRKEPEELEEMEERVRELKQQLGETKKKIKDYNLKLEFNREQKRRVMEGKRPFFVRDITQKKFRNKFRWEADAKDNSRRNGSEAKSS